MRDEVAAGAAFLDEHRPGWWREIDVARLDMGNTCWCVLGQLYTMFHVGCRLLDISEEFGEDARLGFDAAVPTDHEKYAELQCLWVEKIQQRAAQESERKPCRMTTGEILESGRTAFASLRQ